MRVDGLATLREFHDAYAPLLREGLTSNAIAAYDRAWRLRVEPSLGGIPLAELRTLTIDAVALL